MNVALLKKVRDRILRQPQKFRMELWTCGTAHCIGGWACIASGLRLNPADDTVIGKTKWRNRWIGSQARRLIGVSPKKADRLFSTLDWPNQFREAYQLAGVGTRARARIAAKRIDHFIATNGEE